MNEVMTDFRIERRFLGYEFECFIKSVLDEHPNFRNISQDVKLSSSQYMVDIIAECNYSGVWKKIILEIKVAPTYSARKLDQVIKQLQNYKGYFREEVLAIFVFPGVLTKDANERLQSYGIEVWDKIFIIENFYNQIVNMENNSIYKDYFLPMRVVPEKERDLIDKLKLISAGKKGWSKYQKHIEKILSYLFEKTLSEPITEISDKYGANRRDFILRNYSENRFWKYLREKYQADFIVLDAKNYVGKIKKNQILQISNYLKKHGTGLFAIIISRNGEEDKSSYTTRREKWILEQKMIIILSDDDMEKMVLAKSVSNAPEEIIVQKIEEFRLGI